jgi:hypothetical protein
MEGGILSAEDREQQFIDGKGCEGHALGKPANLGCPGRASKLESLGLPAAIASRGVRFGVLTTGSQRVAASARGCQAGMPLEAATGQSSL